MILTSRPSVAALTDIVGADDSGHPGRHVRIRNTSGTTAAEIGPPGFAAGTGYGLAAGEVVDLPLQAGDRLAARAGLAVTLHVIVTGA